MELELGIIEQYLAEREESKARMNHALAEALEAAFEMEGQ